MSTTTDRLDTADLPDYPAARSPKCPYQPPAEYREFKKLDGLQLVRLRHGDQAWLVTRYDDVRGAMSDSRLSADFQNPNLPVEVHGPPAFPRMDDPEHADLRLQFTSRFTVKKVQTLRGAIEEIVDETLEALVSGPNPRDLMHHYALPIPSRVICLLLGVPYEAHELFQDNSSTLFDAHATKEQKTEANMAMYQFLSGLIQRKISEPADDILSSQAELVAAGELSVQNAVTSALSMLIAGHETTSNMIALGIFALLQYPEQLAQVRDTDDPKVIATAVEELLRFLTIAENAVARVATEDLVIGGQLIRKDEGVLVCLPAANRDEKFEGAEDLDITRNTRGHVAFGFGIHACLGQNLARLELQIAIPALLRRLPDLRLAVPVEGVKMRLGTVGVEELPVTW